MPTTQDWIRPIADRIQQLRRQLSQAVWVRGLGRILLLLIGLVAVDLLLDWTFRFDRSQRIVMLGLIIVALVWAVRRWLVLPLSLSTSDDGLCLELERADNNHRNALISAWQLSRTKDWQQKGLSTSLVEATIRLGSDAAAHVDTRRLFDLGESRRNITMLVLGMAGVVALGAGSATVEPLKIWLDRNILLGDSQWPQKTYLIVEGLDDEGRLPVVRGEDHKLVVRIDERSENKDVEVFFDYRDAGSRYRQKLRKFEQEGDVRFEHTFGTVVTEFKFQVFGGDARSEWIQVRLVEPPGFEQITMTARPPEYTGLAPFELERGRSPYDLPLGSSLVVEGVANKPLATAELRSTERNFPFELTDPTHARVEIPAADLIEGKYVFDFVDSQGLTTRRPPSFNIRLIEDRAPRVRASTYGIGGLVVPRARVPMKVAIEDEYQIVDARLQYTWKGDQSDSIAQENEVTIEEAAALLPSPKVDFNTVLDLEPLQIPEGASLLLTIRSHDNKVDEPNDGESKTFLLRVVSESELRTDLLRREREQREVFERQMTEQEEMLTDIMAAAAEIRRSEMTSEPPAIDAIEMLLTVRRRQRALGTQLLQIADTFEAMLIEAENNRLDEESGRLRDRIGRQIVDPIRKLVDEELAFVDESLDSARVSGDTGEPLAVRMDETTELQREVTEQLETILAAMVKAEGYQEAINLLREIERTQQRVRDETDAERRRRIQSIFEGQDNQ
ncbi:MAG: hypothetical protein KDA83_04385 [Planctomycetales bacterium]|nr:hypothetical protein [Planctomycetales bacterium]